MADDQKFTMAFALLTNLMIDNDKIIESFNEINGFQMVEDIVKGKINRMGMSDASLLSVQNLLT